MKKVVLVVILAFLLQGCVAAFAAGAATGAVIVNDKRNIKTMMQDQSIEQQVGNKITANESLDKAHIVVVAFDGVVLLAGQAPTTALRNKAVQLARSVPDIKRIYNEIKIMGPTSALTRSSDAWITTKVKTSMLATSGLKSGQIKVITENGTVYLMGIVTREQADLAAGVARRISGVERVVKIFEIEPAKK